MIDSYKIREIARISGLRPWQQEKHYLQSLVLDIISDFPLTFKGGTYLWFFHGLSRFSEDLGFTAVGTVRQNMPEYVSKTLALYGFRNDLKIIKNNSLGIAFRFMIDGPLNINEKDRCVIYTEISKREKIVLPSLSFKIDFPQYDMPIKTVRGMNLDEVGAEKVRAILTSDKSRDIYDLFYLITRKGINFNPVLVNEELAFYSMDFDSTAFMKKLESMGSSFSRELKPIVLGDLPDFAFVRKTIGEFISRLN